MGGARALIVLDTHAWLWHATAPERLSAAARALIDASDEVGVCTISCWEIAMLERHRKIQLDRALRDWIASALALEHVQTIPLSAEIAIDAALISAHLSGDPADRIIYASARRLRARLVTKDAALRRFDRELTLW